MTDDLTYVFIVAAVAWLCWQIPRDMKREREGWATLTPAEAEDRQSRDAW